MTTITQPDIADIIGGDDNTSWTFYVPALRESDSGTGIVTPRKERVYPIDGTLTVELDPGPAVVIAADGKHYPFIVPDSDSDLWSLIEAAVAIPANTSAQNLADAVAAWLNQHVDGWASANILGVRRPLNNVVVGLGSSVTTWATYDGSYMPGCYDNFIGHLCLESMQRMRFGGIIGHGGYTQAQIISNYLPTIVAMDPAPGACVYFDTPFNDIAVGGLTFAQTKTNFLTIINALLARGILPIVGTVPAHSYGDTFQAGMMQWNRWIRRYAATNGFPLIDLVTIMADIDGDGAVALNNDEVHPNSLGHKYIAQQALADGLLDVFTPAGSVLTSKWIGDTANLLNDGTNNVGLFNADTNVDGVSDGWTLNTGLAANCSRVTPASGDRLVGKWQRMQWTTGQTALWLLKTVPTGISTGDVLAVSARIRTTGVETAQASWTVALHQYFSGGYTYPAPGSGIGGISGYVPAGCPQWGTDVDDGLMYTEVTALAGTTSRFASIQLSGVGTTGTAVLDVGEFTIVNLTTGALL